MDTRQRRRVCALRPAVAARPQTAAFTLIELVGVLTIIVALLSVVLGSFFGWTRVGGVDAAASLTVSALHFAREQAITLRVNTQVACCNLAPNGRAPYGAVAVWTAGDDTNDIATLALPTNSLPANICFRTVPGLPLEFLPDGTCHAPDAIVKDGCALLILDNTAGPNGSTLSRVVEVNLLSGRIRVRREDEP